MHWLELTNFLGQEERERAREGGREVRREGGSERGRERAREVASEREGDREKERWRGWRQVEGERQNEAEVVIVLYLGLLCGCICLECEKVLDRKSVV